MRCVVDFSNLPDSVLQVVVYSLFTIFIVIVVLVTIFSIVPKIRGYLKNSSFNNNTYINGVKTKNSNIPAGDSAAIAAAIFLFMDEIHDSENRVVTIKRVSRTYSPWNSKIYGINWIKNR